MRGLRNEMIESHSQFIGIATDTIDVDSSAGDMVIATEMNYGTSTFDFGVSSADINNAFGSGSAATHNARLKRFCQ